MDESGDSPPPPERLSRIPSWVMLGFALGALFVLALPRRAPPEAEGAPPPPASVRPAPPEVSTIEAVFATYGRYAAWDGDLTQVALWDTATKSFDECFEVLRIGDLLYFRSIPHLTRPLLTHGLPENLPLRYTETEAQRQLWLGERMEENWRGPARRRRLRPREDRAMVSAMLPASDPILTCAAARRFEAEHFGGDEAAEWAAMARAGGAVAAAVVRDFAEIGGLPANARLLVLAGKGHNAGDALIAAQRILEDFPGAQAEVAFVFGCRALRPLTQRAWRELSQGGRARVTSGPGGGGYDLCLDGIFGFQFRPPLPPAAAALLRRVERLPIRLRAAVDLPSGLGARDAFRADFTYATGIVKAPVLDHPEAGRLRYLDLGFFASRPVPAAAGRVLVPAVLAPLAALRPAEGDKRVYGHVCLIGGSVNFPGAILMATLAALRSGAGLVTACVPASLASAFAARAPEAMWVGLPETAAGALALSAEARIASRLERADAMVIGPGLGRDPGSLALVAALLRDAKVPVVIDADALQPEIVRAARAPLILTPHAGEFSRIAGTAGLRAYSAATGATVVLKGPVTRVASPGRTPRPVFHSFGGGPVLARGGSGDLLAGLIGGLLAGAPREPLLAACRGVTWHGLAAEALARRHGQTSVQTTQLLDFLPEILRA